MIGKINWRLLVILAIVVGGYYILSNFLVRTNNPLNIAKDSLVFLRGCNDPDSACLKISLSFPVIQDKVSGRLMKKMLSDYLYMLEDSSESSNLNSFKQELQDNTLRYDSAYIDYLNEFPNTSAISWFLDIDYNILRNDGKVLTLRYLYTDYMGGAHGMYSYHYQNFDLRKSRLMELSDIVSDTEALKQIAKSIFDKKYGSHNMLASGNFWFSGDNFVLPKEFGFSNKGLILHYNVYEIASYSQGDILILVPYSELKNILKRRWTYLAMK